jgi:hypothetical protein
MHRAPIIIAWADLTPLGGLPPLVRLASTRGGVGEPRKLAGSKH